MHSGSGPGSHARLEAPLVAGRYELVKALSRGGMGEVFLARDRVGDGCVALKRVRQEHHGRPKILAHFRAEYHALARLRHPRIIQVYEYGVDAGVPFYTMELLDGLDLRELAPAPYREACGYLRDVASSLALLHAQRLLHRDLSPRNVRRTDDGHCKLIDFGTMTPFGIPRDVAGTAPFVPPEAADCAALDQRADLYALGALAYWLLSGRHAYPASTLDELPGLWPNPVAPLRAQVPDVPEDLDALIMSLLDLNPLKRPLNAAEVIERLNAIAQLEPEGTVEVALGYLSSSKLCGRDSELAKLQSAIARGLRGEGSALSIEGSQGIGKTRLLQELAVLGQTQGMLILRGFGASEQGGQRLVRQLHRALERAAPELGSVPPAQPSSQRPSSAPGRSSKTSSTALAALDNGNLLGFEERAKEQMRLRESFVRLAAGRPLLLVVDDLDRADEFSASLVASLAHQAAGLPLLVVASVGADRPPVAEAAVAAFRQHAEPLKLGPLNLGSVRELVSSMVGDVPNLERLVDWLDRGARGNPALTMELSQLLVNKGLLQYQDGTWVLPEGEITERLPRNLVETLSLRLAPLSPMARRLAEHVALTERGAPLELCLRVTGASQEETLHALDELIAAGIFVGARGGFAFAQGALREAVQQSLNEERKREIDHQLGHALLSLSPTLEGRLQAGAHLVRTEDDLVGADLLAEVAPALIREGRAWDVAIPAMERALEVYERRGAPLKKSLPLRQQLVLSGYLFDYRLAFKYGEETLAKIASVAGVRMIEKLSRFVGAWIAFLLALGVFVLCQPFTAKTRGTPNIWALLVLLGRSVMGIMGVRATSLDAEGGQRVVDGIAPFGQLRFTGLHGVHLACRALAVQSLGREAELEQRIVQALKSIDAPIRLGMTEVDRVDLKVGLLLSGGINECYRIGSRALERAEALEALGTQLARASAHRIRMTYYLVRGNRERTDHYRRLIELHGIQGGTTWQLEWFAAPIEGMASTRYGDLVSARRALARLDALATELPSLASMRDMLRIGYHARRGDLELAVELGERFIAVSPPRTVIGWGNAYADIAGAYNRLGRHERAREICERGLAAIDEADREYMIMYAPLELELSVALTCLGDRAAAERLESYWSPRLEAAGELAILLVMREARVVAAAMSGAREELRESLQGLRSAAECTGCASLIAHAARVAHTYEQQAYDIAARDDADVGSDLETAHEGSRPARSRLHRMLSELRGYTRARSTHVYLPGTEDAVSIGDAPPEDVRQTLEGLCQSRPGSGVVPAGSHITTELEARTQLEARGFTLEVLAVDSQVALLVLERPEVARAGYAPFLEDITELVRSGSEGRPRAQRRG